jgi:hypothetical protein
MSAETHPDPFHDAMNHGLQRALQVASSVMTGTQVYVYLKRTQAMAAAERDERARRVLVAQIRADREAARAGWAPALDPNWLRQADLFQAARTWGAAMPYADRSVPWYEPAAATALRKSEERLRDLHPHAMARYDRLRSDGMGPAEAMREAAPLFARPPRAYDTPYTPRQVLNAGDGETLTWAAAAPVPISAESSAEDLARAHEQRGRQIVAALQARARQQRRDPLSDAEQRTVLEAMTNLPADVIDRVVQPSATRASESAESASAAAPTGRADRPWEHDFPAPIQAVVANASPAPQAPAAARAPVQRQSRTSRLRR